MLTRGFRQKLGCDIGCPDLALPALGSFLFSTEAAPDLEECEISNHDLLDAVRALAFSTDGHSRRLVDYKNLGSEELGSVYESLLELHPILTVDAGAFELKTAGGHERKTTGSYYTPTSLIQCLLDSALTPVLEEAARQENPEAAILKLKVCDPACGSGHFLIAAAHRIAKRLATIRTGDDEPSPDATRTALRDVIGHCIYGVDVNPMAVELCKVSLWMEALEPGKPLSFLDHRIQCGNSLLGATPALLKKGVPDEAFDPIEGDDKEVCRKFKKLNREERKGQGSLCDASFQPWERLGDLAAGLLSLEEIPDDTIVGVRHKQERYEDLVRSSGYLYGRLWADAWCAAFVWKTTKEFPYPITEEAFRRIERNPFSIAQWMREEIQRLAQQYQFFHWHLTFLDVFRVPTDSEKPKNEQTGWSGGFDVVLGNPPWDRVKHDETEWFAQRAPGIANAPTTAARKKLIERLSEDNPALARDFVHARRIFEGTNLLIRDSKRYLYGASGELNLAILFAETATILVNHQGRAGLILPTAIVTDKSAQPLCQFWIKNGRLASVYDFENREGIFPGVHRSYKFCLLSLVGESSKSDHVDAVFYATKPSDLADERQRLKLELDIIRQLNPNTLSFPVIRSKRDMKLLAQIHQQTKPLLLDSATDGGSWGYGVFFLFEMNRASHLFQTLPGSDLSSLLEAKLIHQFNHRAATFYGQSNQDRENGNARDLTTDELANPSISAQPRYWLPRSAVDAAFNRGDLQTNWAVVIREITNSTNERTVITCIIPRVGMGHTCWTVRLARVGAPQSAFFVANLDSFVLDYAARQKVGGTHMSNFIVKQLPVFPPNRYDECVPWTNKSFGEWLLPGVLELIYAAWDLEPFAKDCGYDGPPFRWDEERRFLLRCELDAAYFHLYSIARDDVDYIMETFPIVKRKDEKKYGEYHTKEWSINNRNNLVADHVKRV